MILVRVTDTGPVVFRNHDEFPPVREETGKTDPCCSLTRPDRVFDERIEDPPKRGSAYTSGASRLAVQASGSEGNSATVLCGIVSASCQTGEWAPISWYFFVNEMWRPMGSVAQETKVEVAMRQCIIDIFRNPDGIRNLRGQ